MPKTPEQIVEDTPTSRLQFSPGSDAANQFYRIRDELHTGCVAELGRLAEAGQRLDELLVLYSQGKELSEQTPALKLDPLSLDAGAIQLMARAIYPAIRICAMTLPALSAEAGILPFGGKDV